MQGGEQAASASGKMSSASPHPPFSAIIVAAGKGLRAGQPLPKQFAQWKGKPVLSHSLESLAEAGARNVVVAIPDGAQEHANAAVAGIDGVHLVTGGATRQASVLAALEALSSLEPDCERVLIHDAARPCLPQSVVERVLAALDKHEGAIPALPVVDSLAVEEAGTMAGAADRDSLRRVQTPQGFRFADILSAHREARSKGYSEAGDDAQLLKMAGKNVALVEGDEALKKLTFQEDFMVQNQAQAQVRTGMGFDVHRLEAGQELWLGGLRIDHDRGLAGHSDADVALHALVDAVLGAIGEGDIGTHFPPSDEQWRGAASSQFLKHAAQLARDAGYRIGNVDLTIICEAPKIGPHRPKMREIIAGLLGVDLSQVSVKATTTERLGLTGRGEGIAAQAIATMICEG